MGRVNERPAAKVAAWPRLQCWSWLQGLCGLTAVLLALTAVAKLYGGVGRAPILAVREELRPLTNRELLLGVGLIELAVGAYVLWGRSVVAEPLWVLWLRLNFGWIGGMVGRTG